jgi:hypothetical protein
MNDLSTNIGSQIGALELGGYPESHIDGVLETAAYANVGPTITNCTMTNCASDGALEAAGANMALGPTQVNCGLNPTIVIRCISDGALESAGTTLNGPPTRMIIGTRCQ